MKKKLNTWICLMLVLLLAFAGITAAAEGTEEQKVWAQLATDAFNAQNYEKSFYYFTLLADVGDLYAQCMVAYHYLFGLGVEQDYEKAAE